MIMVEKYVLFPKLARIDWIKIILQDFFNHLIWIIIPHTFALLLNRCRFFHTPYLFLSHIFILEFKSKTIKTWTNHLFGWLTEERKKHNLKIEPENPGYFKLKFRNYKLKFWTWIFCHREVFAIWPWERENTFK